MANIITLTLNPALDVTYKLDRLNCNSVNIVSDKWLHPGGKGINVAKVLAAMGADPICWTLLGGYTGDLILELLKPQPFKVEYLQLNSVSRQNIKLHVNSSYTEINETGPHISAKELEEFEEQFFPFLSQAKILVLSGSLPQSIPDDYYARLTVEAERQGLQVILDTSGEPLRQGLTAGPFLVKPNREELESLLNIKLKTSEQIVKSARETVALGAKNVLVSMGAQGAVLVNADGAWESRPPEVRVSSPLGAGDSMVAGCAAYLASTANHDYRQMLQEATAAGTAAVEQPGSHEPDRRRIKQLLTEVIVSNWH